MSAPVTAEINDVMQDLTGVPCVTCMCVCVCVQDRGAAQYRGVFSTVGDIMMHVGDILSTVGDVQYHGGYH